MRGAYPRSADLHKVDDEDEGRVRRDRPGALGAVAELGWDHQLAATADLHAGEALVPAADDHPGAELDGEVLPAPGRVELLAVRVRDADVLHGDLLAGDRFGAGALDQVRDDEVARRWAVRDLDLRLLGQVGAAGGLCDGRLQGAGGGRGRRRRGSGVTTTVGGEGAAVTAAGAAGEGGGQGRRHG